MPTPPTITAGTAPSQAAVRPDSSSPRSFELEMKTMLTALTRPRISCGVRSCTTVERITTLTMSVAPSTASAASDSPKCRDSPEHDRRHPEERHAAEEERARPGG